jgi:hypothetical protein
MDPRISHPAPQPALPNALRVDNKILPLADYLRDGTATSKTPLLRQLHLPFPL